MELGLNEKVTFVERKFSHHISADSCKITDIKHQSSILTVKKVTAEESLTICRPARNKYILHIHVF
jgi:hypothetical protein